LQPGDTGPPGIVKLHQTSVCEVHSSVKVKQMGGVRLPPVYCPGQNCASHPQGSDPGPYQITQNQLLRHSAEQCSSSVRAFAKPATNDNSVPQPSVANPCTRRAAARAARNLARCNASRARQRSCDDSQALASHPLSQPGRPSGPRSRHGPICIAPACEPYSQTCATFTCEGKVRLQERARYQRRLRVAAFEWRWGSV
jgi:hypothetical protein